MNQIVHIMKTNSIKIIHIININIELIIMSQYYLIYLYKIYIIFNYL